MSEPLNTVQANIENLTSLWKTAALPFGTYHSTPVYHYCDVIDSGWPNRLWFNEDITAGNLEAGLKIVPAAATRFHLPYWDIYNSKSYEMIEAKGFPKVSEQAGMSLQLQQPFALKNNLQFKEVSTVAEAALWTKLFQQAFGYRINDGILLKTLQHIYYFIAYDQQQPIGTAILYTTGPVAGIHSVGVIPDMRRKGFADEIMKFILNKAIESKATHATLQASTMGKGLYLKLGFEDEFVIRNYRVRG
jgi:ribosomal protein S18 acetylase RimI-like enzyme